MKKVIIYALVILLLIFLICGIPLIINESYKTSGGYITVWNGADVLAFYGAIFSALGSIVLGIVAWRQNKRLGMIEERTFLAQNSGSALITKISISGIKTFACNLNSHIEQIVATKEFLQNEKSAEYSSVSITCSLQPLNTQQHITLVSLKSIVLTSSKDGEVLSFSTWAKSIENNYSRVAISQTCDSFQFTVLMTRDEKNKFVESLKSGDSQIVLEMNVLLLNDKNVATELSCRANLQYPDYDEREEVYCKFKTLDDDPPMCFWKGTTIIEKDNIKIKETAEETNNG